MSIYLLIGVVAVLWLFSFAAGVFGLRWTIVPGARRVRAALVASCLALASAYVGLSWLRLSASRTVNGHVEWSFNSKWFFLSSLLLGAVSLALALWNWKKADKTVLPP